MPGQCGIRRCSPNTAAATSKPRQTTDPIHAITGRIRASYPRIKCSGIAANAGDAWLVYPNTASSRKRCNYVSRIKDKLGVRTIAGMVSYAHRAGLVG